MPNKIKIPNDKESNQVYPKEHSLLRFMSKENDWTIDMKYNINKGEKNIHTWNHKLNKITFL